jgi:hypothetical protein
MASKKELKAAVAPADAAKNSPVDLTRWPTRAAAARILKCSISTVRRLQSDGDLAFVTDGNGISRFDPTVLDDLADGNERPEEVMSGLVEKFASLIAEPPSKLLAVAVAESERKDKRISELEQRLSEMLDTVERARTLEHERELKRSEWQRQEDRKDQAIELLAPKVLPIIESFVSRFAPPGEARTSLGAPQTSALASPKHAESQADICNDLGYFFAAMVTAIPADRFHRIEVSDLFTPEELQHMRDVRVAVAAR